LRDRSEIKKPAEMPPALKEAFDHHEIQDLTCPLFPLSISSPKTQNSTDNPSSLILAREHQW